MTLKRLVLTLAFGILLAAGLAAALPWIMPAQQTASRSSGQALVGGPFELTDQNGNRVKDTDFRGKFMLVYFGYTFCPDVCPTELQVMTAAVDQLGSDADSVQPIFITVDPERDTVEQMKLYVSNFSDRLIGLTGSPEDVATATKAYRVYSAKVKDQNSVSDYLMDHTSMVFLMGPNGEFRRVFSHGTDAETMRDGIRDELAKS
jgi:cytochrome oxidase Cu insertion factor (SCO1/SenC/PrrC family)